MPGHLSPSGYFCILTTITGKILKPRLLNDQLDVYGQVTIEGHGQIIERASSGTGRIFYVNGGGNLNLHQVTVQNGLSDGLVGGGIRIGLNGVANILDSAIINNATSSGSSGGGILNQGTLNLANSILSTTDRQPGH